MSLDFLNRGAQGSAQQAQSSLEAQRKQQQEQLQQKELDELRRRRGQFPGQGTPSLFSTLGQTLG